MKVLLTTLLLVLCLNSCNFQKEADAKFGDQYFKSTIALVELHKVRYGAYPDSLSELKFLGDWDRLFLASVEYKRSGDGYDLDVKRGWIQEPTLRYPPEFWHGLGLKRSNVLKQVDGNDNNTPQ